MDPYSCCGCAGAETGDSPPTLAMSDGSGGNASNMEEGIAGSAQARGRTPDAAGSADIMAAADAIVASLVVRLPQIFVAAAYAMLMLVLITLVSTSAGRAGT